jgi:hypothetical protein
MKKLLIGILALGSLSAFGNCSMSVEIKGDYGLTGCQGSCRVHDWTMEKRANRIVKMAERLGQSKGYKIVSETSSDYKLVIDFSEYIQESEVYYDVLTSKATSTFMLNNGNIISEAKGKRTIGGGDLPYSDYKNYRLAAKRALKSIQIPNCN